ncbi:MAG: glycine cleavage system protein R [Candidatus Methylacidiphilales bacterium]
MSSRALIMTIIGEDKPGLVDSIASLIRAHDGNWLESRMCNLSGRFAGILRAHIPSEREEELLAALAGLRNQVGLTVTVQHEHPTQPAVGPTFHLQLVGNDRPGIISQVSRTLAAHRVNVESLDTHTESAPMAGGTLFHAEARLQLLPGCHLDALRADLEKIAADLMVDLSLSHHSQERAGR